MKHIKLILFLVAIIAVAVLLIINKFLVYGIILIGFALVVYFLWNIFIKNRDKKIAELTKTIDANKQLIQELEQRKINISQITSILELNLLEIDSYYTRVFNRTYSDGKLMFLGALRIDIKAKYGIDIKELKIKEEDNKVLVYIKPKFLSFTHRKCDWQISETMELVERGSFKKFFGAEDYWRRCNDKDTLNRCEVIRKETELQLENGIEELKWIEKPLQNQILNILKTFLFSQKEVCLCDYSDETFVGIDCVKQIGTNNKSIKHYL